MNRTVIRRRIAVRTLAAALALFGGAALVHAAQSLDAYGYLQGRPLPKTAAEHDSECAWIRSEEARIQSQAEQGLSIAAKYNSPGMAESIKTTAIRDLGHLDDRYAQIQCAVVGTAAIPPAIQRPANLLAPYQLPAAAPQPPAPQPPAVQQAPAIARSPSFAPPAPAPLPAAAQPQASDTPPPTVTAPRPSALPPAPAAAAPSQSGGGLTFDQCFAKCRELTSRTAEQCFDTCRH